ncbi:desaturase [Hylemonella gracilis str. Niagara R]|uniref:Desaturase n=1 Tax=Hylemonella gracilis str. Niagara R TaxID=1458275 RepID=A0A016XFS7_9BURK|nr:hydroxysqualene dehydroxylase HpnE [Hylemonella gracilis]EYC50949.1 desaturase [Hylemonella gracilis str. Niagara R]
MKIAIVGAGWAGLAAAITATLAGHQVTLYEAARTPGGRARGLDATLPNGRVVRLDNGQHILIGAYTETLRLLRTVGVTTDNQPESHGETALLRLPLTLIGPDGQGLRLPHLPASLPASWGVLAAVLRHPSWPWRERLGLLRAALRWQAHGFQCDEALSVAELCAQAPTRIGPRVQAELIEPLCVSALNTSMHEASAQVFLRVLRDALFATPDGADLLLPRVDLGTLFPEAALRWLSARGTTVHLGQRVRELQALQGQDLTLLACPAPEAARLAHEQNAVWAAQAQALQHTVISTVYAWHPEARLRAPMLALPSSARHPAQFAFDRGQLDASGQSQGLLAFVVSASTGEREDIEAQVLQQAQAQLGLTLQAVQTIVEKRATFACTPGLSRPLATIAPTLWACGDYVAGPYPATLEGAVRSGVAAVQAWGEGIVPSAGKPTAQ